VQIQDILVDFYSVCILVNKNKEYLDKSSRCFCVCSGDFYVCFVMCDDVTYLSLYYGLFKKTDIAGEERTCHSSCLQNVS
jgi:hypothetical protein